MEINKPMIGKSTFCFKKYISIHFDTSFQPKEREIRLVLK